jgi:DNA-binding NtrC family response regulator
MSSVQPIAPGAAGVVKDVPHILIVDDEPGILSALQRVLGRQTCAVTAFSDPLLAEAAFQEREFALIISDNLMPALTGLELLARIKAQHPLTRRILLTGHTDLNDAVKAFNDVTIHRFINKPWDTAELLSAVNYEVELYSSQLRERDQRVKQSQAIKASATKLVGTVHELKQSQTMVSLLDDAASMEDLNLSESLRRLSVLVVDDNAEVRNLIVNSLKRVGISNSAGAAGSSEALELLQSAAAVDVVVSEWMLGGMDGLGLLKSLRNGQSLSRDAFFLMVTDRENKVLVDHALKQGVNGYLIKPFHLRALLNQFEHAALTHLHAVQKRSELIRSKAFVIANSDPASRDQIQHLLVSHGVREVALANSGGKALQLVKDNLVDVLIYDCNLKDPYWKDIQMTLRGAGTVYLPALVVTSVMPIQTELDEVRRANLTAFLPGPFRQAELFQVIVLALEERDR